MAGKVLCVGSAPFVEVLEMLGFEGLVLRGGDEELAALLRSLPSEVEAVVLEESMAGAFGPSSRRVVSSRAVPFVLLPGGMGRDG